MKKIKITIGTYGYRKDEKSPVVLIDNKSTPIEVKDSEAERLINLGIAECVENLGNSEEDVEQSDDEKLEACSLRELQKIAKEMGLKANGSKEKLIERITEATEEEMDDESDAEEPPVLEAVDPEV